MMMLEDELKAAADERRGAFSLHVTFGFLWDKLLGKGSSILFDV